MIQREVGPGKGQLVTYEGETNLVEGIDDGGRSQNAGDIRG